MKLTKILVPLDGSALAETAIPTAVQFAKEQGAAVVLMRAAEAPWIHGEDIADVQVHIVRDAEKYLDELADRLRAGGSANVHTSVWYGAPSASIVEAAKAQHADLIVMTSHGRTGIGRLILGSVAESVLRGTTTPILLLRATGAAVLPPDGKAKRVEAARV
jgi:nucleotide-binding universal stress UspA family protein